MNIPPPVNPIEGAFSNEQFATEEQFDRISPSEISFIRQKAQEAKRIGEESSSRSLESLRRRLISLPSSSKIALKKPKLDLNLTGLLHESPEASPSSVIGSYSETSSYRECTSSLPDSYSSVSSSLASSSSLISSSPSPGRREKRKSFSLSAHSQVISADEPYQLEEPILKKLKLLECIALHLKDNPEAFLILESQKLKIDYERKNKSKENQAAAINNILLLFQEALSASYFYVQDSETKEFIDLYHYLSLFSSLPWFIKQLKKNKLLMNQYQEVLVQTRLGSTGKNLSDLVTLLKETSEGLQNIFYIVGEVIDIEGEFINLYEIFINTKNAQNIHLKIAQAQANYNAILDNKQSVAANRFVISDERRRKYKVLNDVIIYGVQAPLKTPIHYTRETFLYLIDEMMSRLVSVKKVSSENYILLIKEFNEAWPTGDNSFYLERDYKKIVQLFEYVKKEILHLPYFFYLSGLAKKMLAYHLEIRRSSVSINHGFYQFFCEEISPGKRGFSTRVKEALTNMEKEEKTLVFAFLKFLIPNIESEAAELLENFLAILKPKPEPLSRSLRKTPN